MKIEFSEEVIKLFNESSFKDSEAKLVDLNNGRTINIDERDEDDWIYIPELTSLDPTSLVKNGDDEYAPIDYTFLVKLINEFRSQIKDK